MEYVLRGNITEERVAPMNIYLGDDYAHAYQDRDNLMKRQKADEGALFRNIYQARNENLKKLDWSSAKRVPESQDKYNIQRGDQDAVPEFQAGK